MSGVEKFDFVAPQFVGSLGDGDLEDGADNFFDAQELVAAANTNQIASEVMTNCSEFVETEGSCSEPDNGVANDENKEPWTTKNHGRDTRLHRMSVKKTTPPSRKNTKFMSLAEQVHKFHHATPPRFKRKSGVYRTRSSKLLPTIAMSPLLQTKGRVRASTVQPVTATQTQRPVLKPVKHMTAKPPPKPAPKPVTVPQPFNLTDVNKFKKVKPVESNELQDVISKAKSTVVAKKNTNAVPKTAQKSEMLAEPSGSKPTPQKPVNTKRKTLKVEGEKVTVTEDWGITGLKTVVRPTTWTKPVPFSFERREQERLKAKQLKAEEAEKKQKSPSGH